MIEVEYEILEPLSDPETSLQDNSPKIHPKGNLLSEIYINRGNVERAFEKQLLFHQEHIILK